MLKLCEPIDSFPLFGYKSYIPGIFVCVFMCLLNDNGLCLGILLVFLIFVTLFIPSLPLSVPPLSFFGISLSAVANDYA